MHCDNYVVNMINRFIINLDNLGVLMLFLTGERQMFSE